jgi:hypothetical protein
MLPEGEDPPEDGMPPEDGPICANAGCEAKPKTSTAAVMKEISLMAGLNSGLMV